MPAYIENEAAYNDAIRRNIQRNAATGKRARFMANHPDAQQIIDWVLTTSERGNTFACSLYQGMETYGALTDGQAAAVRKIIAGDVTKKAEAKAKNMTSVHVGVVGTRQILTATIVFIASYDTAFGTCYVQGMKDADGNLIIYKGKNLGFERGTQITFTAGIKEHAVRDDIKQTIIARLTKIEEVKS